MGKMLTTSDPIERLSYAVLADSLLKQRERDHRALAIEIVNQLGKAMTKKKAG